MHMLIQVMRRQERLRSVFTPYLHVFFGGRSSFEIFDNRKSLLQQEKMFLYMTLVINIYTIYNDYVYTSVGSYAGETWFSEIIAWDHFNDFELSFLSVHFGLACLMCIRTLLNSRAADDLEDIKFSNSKKLIIIQVLSWVVTSAVGMFYILLENWWRVLVVILSGGGLYGFLMSYNLYYLYSICLLEIVDQISAIAILVEAMRRNVASIFWTMVILISIFIYLLFK